MRYDWQQAPSDTQNRFSNFSPGVQSHAFNTVNIIGKTGNQLAPIGMLFPGDTGVPTNGAFTPNNHVSPRFGFAWDPFGNGKTVVHGAAGLFFGGISGNQWELSSNFAPFAIRQQFSKVVSMAHPYSNDPTEFPGGTNPFLTIGYTPGTSTANFLALTQVSAVDPHYRWPLNYQINFGVQQQLANGLALSINYVGSLNRKLPLYQDINPPVYNINSAGTSGASCSDLTKSCGYANTSSTVNNRRPLNSQYGLSAASPTYSNVYIMRSNQNSNYNGLQVRSKNSFPTTSPRAGSTSGARRWPATLWTTARSQARSSIRTIPLWNIASARSVDSRHQVTGSFVWTPDYFNSYNRFVRLALNGWTITSIINLQSGTPFTVTTGTDVNGDGQTQRSPKRHSRQGGTRPQPELPCCRGKRMVRYVGLLRSRIGHHGNINRVPRSWPPGSSRKHAAHATLRPRLSGYRLVDLP